MPVIDLNERKETTQAASDVNRDNWRQYLGGTLPHRDMLRLRELAREAGEYVEVVSQAGGMWYICKKAEAAQ